MSSAVAATIPAASAAADVARLLIKKRDAGCHPQELLLSAAGPHGHARFQDSITCTGVASALTLEVRLTVPVPVGVDPPQGALEGAAGSGQNATSATATAQRGGGGAWPVVLHLSGFQCVAAQYAPLAERLATHGYCCVQYTLPRLWPAGTRIVADEAELAALPEVWAWAADRAARAGVPLDAEKVAVVGHSRGGKLAALHYARQWVPPPQPPQPTDNKGRHCRLGGRPAPAPADAPAKAPPPPEKTPELPRLRALFLADPVDNTPALARRGFPSGVEALRAAVRAAEAAARKGQVQAQAPPPRPTLALACAGRFGGGNPQGANWIEFLSAAPPGARSLLLHSAGHATFLQLPPDGSAAARALDLLFGGGAAPRPLVMALTAGMMLAWLRREVLVGASVEADAEEARWLAAVSRAAERAAAAPPPPPAGSAGGQQAPVMVRVSAEVKLGAGPPSGGEEEEEEEAGAGKEGEGEGEEQGDGEGEVAAQVIASARC